MNKVIIVGGGAAGMMAAISASKAGKKVCILEKNENTVSSLLQRARKKMKIQLEEEDSYEEKRLQKRT